MTEITVELIERVAENARLSLTNEEKIKFAKELKEIKRDSFRQGGHKPALADFRRCGVGE